MTTETEKKYEFYDEDRGSNQNKKEDSVEDIAAGEGNPEEGSKVKVKLENFTINVFFDGTGNNAHNTEFRLLDEEYEALQKKRDYYKKELGEISSTDIKINVLTERNGKTYITQREPNRRERVQEEERLKREQARLKKEISDIEQKMDRLIDEKEYKDRTYQKQPNVSYRNEFSNVALLHLGSDEFAKNSKNIYIEGAGTTKDEADDVDGLGMADGEKSGIHVRVNEAFEKMQQIVREKVADRYQINVFGFSRGAFYARVFCAWLKEEKIDSLIKENSKEKPENHTHNLRHDLLDTPPDQFNITLLGIYDTVSSHGWEHYDDPEGSKSQSVFSLADKGKTFPLAVTNDAQGIYKIVHLTAQNDYREHFPLTPITTATSSQPSKGRSALEISFPGAHSNLGGAYNDVWKEEDHYLSHIDTTSETERDGAIHKDWWVEKGYYLEEELSQREKYKLKPGRYIHAEESRVPSYSYYVANRGVRNHYQYITFNAMRMMAVKFGSMKFNEDEERLQERLNIFEQAKTGNDLNASEAQEYDKVITNERARILSTMDEAIRSKITTHMGQHGTFELKLSEYLPDIKDQKILYSTFICNSLQPISRWETADMGKVNEFMPTEEYEPVDKYDIRPEKRNVAKFGRGLKVMTFHGIENEGDSKRNFGDSGAPIRPTVEGG